VDRPEGLLFHPSLQRCRLGFAAVTLQFVESKGQVSQHRQRLGCLTFLHPAPILFEAHIPPEVHLVLTGAPVPLEPLQQILRARLILRQTRRVVPNLGARFLGWVPKDRLLVYHQELPASDQPRILRSGPLPE
jgi:hypothetical protein